MRMLRLRAWRQSTLALLVAGAAWAAGCATPVQPRVEPFFAARSYTPSKIAVLPPAVFAIYDEMGDNDPNKSAALGQVAAQRTGSTLAAALRRQGYAVDTSARWDGVRASDGTVVVSGNDLAWFASAVVEFVNSPAGAAEGPFQQPAFVAPGLAARVGWATQSDALLYVNMKGVSVAQAKRTAQIVGTIFIVVIIAAIILWMVADSQSGGGRSSSPQGVGSGFRGGKPVPRASAGSGWGTGTASHVAATPGATGALSVPRGRGRVPSGGGGRVYGGGSSLHMGVGVFVPIEGPTHTHQGQVHEDDEVWNGDDLYASMTLISAYDGRVLWHMRRNVDVDLGEPPQIDQFVNGWVQAIPPAVQAPAAPPASVPAPPPSPPVPAAPASPPAPAPATPAPR